MASKRTRSDSRGKSIKAVSAWVQRLGLFGPPPLLAGEDPALYDQLVERMCEVLKPLDIIYEMFVADVVYLEWDIIRWRRLKSSLVNRAAQDALEQFLSEELSSAVY